MDALTLSAACILCAAKPSIPVNIARWEPMIVDASARFAIPEKWIAGVMQAESGGRTLLNGQPITSSAGAMGLMQLMPGTYDDMRRQYHLGDDPFDPHDNILAGTAYLRALFDRFRAPGFLAAYNAGPARVHAYLDHGAPLPRETLSYLAKLNMALPEPQASAIPAAKPGTADTLFVPLSAPQNGLPKPSPDAKPALPSHRKPARDLVVTRADSNVQPLTLFFSLFPPAP